MISSSIKNYFSYRKNIKNQKQMFTERILQLKEDFNDADYYQVAKSWRQELYYSKVTSLARSKIINVILALMLMLSFAIILKQVGSNTVEPIVIEKDKATGSYTVIDRVTPQSISQDWPITRFNIMQYVESREQYHPDNINVPLMDVISKSSNSVGNEAIAALRQDGSNSPAKVYGDDKYITVTINNIQKINDMDTAFVDFTKTLHEKDTGRSKEFKYKSVIKWQYSKAKMDYKEQYLNPFNFRVTYYSSSIITTVKG